MKGCRLGCRASKRDLPPFAAIYGQTKGNRSRLKSMAYTAQRISTLSLMISIFQINWAATAFFSSKERLPNTSLEGRTGRLSSRFWAARIRLRSSSNRPSAR